MTKMLRAILLTGTMAVAFSQTLAVDLQAAHPPKDDPSLYSSFCFFVEDLSAWLEARWIAEPARKAELSESAARYLNVQYADLLKLTAACRAMAAALRRINIEAHSYVRGVAAVGETPDVERMDEFDAQRQAAVKAGLDQLRQEVSETSWRGLNVHINGTHRLSIVQSGALSRR